MARAVEAVAANRDAALLMPRLLVEAGHDKELHAIFTEKLVDPRRRIVRTVLERARDRGEIRADVELELAIDMLVGPIIYRFLITEGDLGPAAATASRVLEILLEGLRPPVPGR